MGTVVSRYLLPAHALHIMPPNPTDAILAATRPEQGDGNPFNYTPTVFHIIQAFRLKVWYMLPTLALCGLAEIIGWGGRFWGHKNPICTTIMAPSFMTAAMFLILPRIVGELGQHYSRMSPCPDCPRSSITDPIIFLTADVGALVLQAVGGGVASSAITLDGANRGGNIMLSGIVIQLAAVALFDLLSIEFVVRYTFGRPTRMLPEKHEKKRQIPERVGLMLVGLAIQSSVSNGRIMLMARSYRNGRVISTEKWFNWFDGGAIVVAMVTFNVFHPGLLIKNYGNNLLNLNQTPTNDSLDQKSSAQYASDRDSSTTPPE
ncbi:RTA1 domain-containing protein [Rhizoctonia solani AG-1 IA]|uniref:RTA1 domain-containing protein n=1 Tax=Thanatephorus cucumeris (strain AG1-IA) TaxID=983506 RepID=L8WSP4_THACA|nr:RTA1 domain-containing protein [Rhizoctonia solani AG-1 IA]